MSVEQQYIDLFSQAEAMICRHSAELLRLPTLNGLAFPPANRRNINIRMSANTLNRIMD